MDGPGGPVRLAGDWRGVDLMSSGSTSLRPAFDPRWSVRGRGRLKATPLRGACGGLDPSTPPDRRAWDRERPRYAGPNALHPSLLRSQAKASVGGMGSTLAQRPRSEAERPRALTPSRPRSAPSRVDGGTRFCNRDGADDINPELRDSDRRRTRPRSSRPCLVARFRPPAHRLRSSRSDPPRRRG